MKTVPRKILLFSLLLFYGLSLLAQTSISGTVVDSDNEPLIGATVQITSTGTGTTTDIDGNFSLSLSGDEGGTLEVSYIGYETKIVSYQSGQTNITITLSEGAVGLDEVLVIGSSITQERKRLGNAVTTLKSEKLVEASPNAVTDALQGKVPGAQITQNSGDPAGGFSIRLRGPSTIKGSSEPLYVVDGVVVSNLTTNVTNLNVPGGDASPGQNRMVDINPNDIDNINILNGAAAAAIYGSRASNGVVIITTKKGSFSGSKPNFYFKTGINFNSIRKKLDLNLNGEQFETVANSSLSGRLWPIFGFNPESGVLTPFNYLSSDKIAVTRYDYQDDIFDTGIGTDNYLSVRGGSGSLGYMGSVGYTSNEGIVKNTKYNRLSARFAINQQINPMISYNLGFYYANGKTEEKPDGNVFWSPINSVNITNNIYDLSQRDASGNLMAVENTRVNPLSIIETFDINQKIDRFIPSARLKINPIENLTIDQIFGLDTYKQKGHIFIPVYPYANVNPAYYNNGYLGEAEAKVNNWNYDINAIYDIDISDKVNSETTGGYSFQASHLTYDGTQGRDLDSQGKPTVPLQTGAIDSRLDIFGFFLQQTFGFDDKLFITAAGRMDGATNFDVDERSNFYPKVSLSYVPSREAWWSESSIINSARVRASYGEAGNLTAISPYERFGSYNSIEFLGSSVLQQNSRLGNEGLRPERTKEFEIGTDLSFWESRVNLLYSFYSQRVSDLIISKVVSPSLGGTTQTVNAGTMKNIGHELYLNIVPIKTQDAQWNFNLNFSRNKNEVLSTVGEDITIANVAGAPPLVRAGEPLGVFYGTYFATDNNGNLILSGPSDAGAPEGVPQPERGDLATGQPMRDSNGQPTGDLLRKVIGDPNPDFLMGIGTDFTYRAFRISVLFETVQGFDVFDADKRTRQGVGLGRLARQELTGELPRGYIAGIYPIEEFRMEDGSFTKLRELSASYTIPELGGALSNFRISLIGRNLISFDNFFSYDPETNAGGQSNLLRAVNFGNVPIPRTFTFSLSANF